MPPDPQIISLLNQLSSKADDPLQPLWTYVSDTYDDGDCCKALRLLIAALRAIQDGKAARIERKFDSCPYPTFEGAPMQPSDYLNMAWESGHDEQDQRERCRQAEGKVYDAFKSLEDIRDFSDNLARGRTASMGACKAYDARIRNLHGTILTSAVKLRIRREQEAEQELLFGLQKDENEAGTI